MPKEKGLPKIRLNRLKLKNFKLFNEIEIDFPKPLMKGDPDVFVMGSKNGLGKTSVLEACGILSLILVTAEYTPRFERFLPMGINLADLLIKAGASKAIIEATFDYKSSDTILKVIISDEIEIIEGQKLVKEFMDYMREYVHEQFRYDPELMSTDQFKSLFSIDSEPLIVPPFLYFNSNRKVREGSTELGNMIDYRDWERYYAKSRRWGSKGNIIGRFKLEILRALMSRGGLFENIYAKEADDTAKLLNKLLEKYADGTIEKLRSLPDSKIEFRITPTDGSASYAFDGLSSGQKEIISTLFLIWRYTKDNPGIVLIDEPELHLNAEWQTRFIRDLNELVPGNQYILATHSEQIFSSVEPEQRAIIRPDQYSRV